MEEQAESLLRQLGLSEYETKACMVLVKFGASDANKISSVGNIPLPRVYDTMENLARRGLISISKSRPQTFSIINMKRFFEIIKLDEKKKIENKINTIDQVSSKFFKAVSAMPKMKYESPDDALLTLTKRSANVEEIWNRLHDETKKEFLVFAGDVSWINRRAREIKNITKKGVSYKIIWFKCTKEVMPNIRKAIRMGAEMRCIDEFSNDLRCIISDSNKIYLIQKLLKPGVDISVRTGALWNEEFANYTGTLITSRTIANVFRGYFYFLWEKATPADEIFKRFKK
jgi:sugar-specific transcriptional regulator TrmB